MDAVRRTPVRFAELFLCQLHQDPLVRMRAADAAEKITAERPELLRPFKVALIEQVAQLSQREIRWHVAQMLPRLDLDPGERDQVVKILLGYLEGESAIVKVHAMQGLADLAGDDASLRDQLIPILEDLVRSGSAAVKKRGRKLLAELEPHLE